MAAQHRILVVGRSGQVARALTTVPWPGSVVVEARGRPELDLRQHAEAAASVENGGWSAVVNAAAYTQVNDAESQPHAAFALNRDGPAVLAKACARAGIPLVHLSTDYVFDGTKNGPYVEHDPVRPLSVYGASKAEGEDAVRAALPEHVILRTSWVFSGIGNNFVRTMLALAEREELRIVADQRGRPSAASDIAGAITQIVVALLEGKGKPFGTFHFANAGVTSWYVFACEVFREAERRGLRRVPRLSPIPSSEYPTAAERPMNSVLDTGRIGSVFGITPRAWQYGLAETLDELVGPLRIHAEEAAGR